MVAESVPARAGRPCRVAGLACVLILLAGCSAGVTPPQSPSAGSGGGAATTRTVEVDARPVLLHVPGSPRPSTGAALVVVLHGYTGQAAGAVDFFGLLPLAAERGFVIAAPQGNADSEGRTFWNAARACCDFHGSAVDDSGHLSRVIATIVAGQQVDPERVYVVGHSNGGFMAHRLACEHAGQLAAVASLAGAMDAQADCEPSRPVSVLQVHGEADDSIRYDGGQLNGRPYTSAAETVERWRRANRCPGAGLTGARLDADAEVTGAELTATTWAGCRGGTEVALWTLADSGHIPNLTPTFAAALLDWFDAQPRRG